MTGAVGSAVAWHGLLPALCTSLRAAGCCAAVAQFWSRVVHTVCNTLVISTCALCTAAVRLCHISVSRPPELWLHHTWHQDPRAVRFTLTLCKLPLVVHPWSTLVCGSHLYLRLVHS